MEQLHQAVDSFVSNGSYLKNGITQKEAADEMGIATYRLKTWLNTTEHKTFSHWITHLRLEKAKEILLKTPTIGGEELVERCGFCDRQYLQRVFLKWTGMTPSQWVRNEIQKEVSPQ